jgi:hypothetical protein
VTRLFLSEALDSKLIAAGDYDKLESEEIFLRLRLHVLMIILFQRKLLISEGWALDSMSFIRVASEIIGAAESLYRDGMRDKELAQFSPIVMEKRRQGDFRAVFQSYADREDVRWSGFMPFTSHQSIRSAISRGLRDAAARSVQMPDAIYDTFSQIMPGSFIAQDMANVARYFSEPISGANARLLSVTPSQTAFQEGFDSFLRDAARLPAAAGAAEALLARVANYALVQGMSFRTSSLAMQFSDRQDDTRVRDALMKAINVTYMKVSSDAANAIMSTPAHETGSFNEEIDKALVECLHGSKYNYDLFFVLGYRADHDLTRKIQALRSEDWRLVWKKTIQLSISLDWKKAVFDFVKVFSSEGWAQAVKSKEYESLENMLAKNVPELVIDFSLAYRLFGYRGSEATKKKFAAVSGAASGAALSSAIGGLIGGLIGAVGGAVGGAMLKENYPDSFNIFSGAGLGSKRSSVLEPKIRK